MTSKNQKVNAILTTLLLSMMASNSFGYSDVIYGDDGRVDIRYESDSLQTQFTRSVAARVRSSDLTKEEGYPLYQFREQTLGDRINLCEGERFRDQKSISDCTGFLVDEETLVTAGHCMNEWTCKHYKWVFDYVEERGVDRGLFLDNYLHEDQVYGCKEVVEREYDSLSGLDYAVVKLDRPTQNRPVLKVRSEGQISEGDDLFVVGHPWGLPLKVAKGAQVRSNQETHFFVANLDTFSGNSGSPVINGVTGEVEGIMVRGEDDQVLDEEQNCYKVKRCEDNECRGEDVVRITSVTYLNQNAEN